MYINKENEGITEVLINRKIMQYGNDLIFECNVSKRIRFV